VPAVPDAGDNAPTRRITPPPGLREDSGTIPPGRRLRWLVGVAAAAVIVVTAALVADRFQGLGTGGTNAQRPNAAPSSVTLTAPAPGGTASISPLSTPTVGNTGTFGGDTYQLLPGWWYYVDPTFKWKIGVPGGWTAGVDPNYTSMTYFDEPTAPRRRLGVDISTHPKPDALADWQTAERVRVAAGELPQYHKVRLEAVPCQFKQCVDWEYTYTGGNVRLHVLNRNIVVSDKRAHAVFWLTPDSVWQESWANLEAAWASFDPGPLV
jgi:hypothetical protein